MVSVRLGTWFAGGADDASKLEEIFCAAFSILKHVFSYARRNGLLSPLSSIALEDSLHFFFPLFAALLRLERSREVAAGQGTPAAAGEERREAARSSGGRRPCNPSQRRETQPGVRQGNGGAGGALAAGDRRIWVGERLAGL